MSKLFQNGRVSVNLSLSRETHKNIRWYAEHARAMGLLVDRAVAEYVQRHHGGAETERKNQQEK